MILTCKQRNDALDEVDFVEPKIDTLSSSLIKVKLKVGATKSTPRNI